MRTAIIVSVVAVAIMLVVAVGAWALATTEFGFFGAETRRSSTDRNTRQEAPIPDISEVGATAVASETTHASPGPGAELVGLITKPRGPVFFELGERIQLEVFGIYSDGASYPLPEDAQIVYASSQPEFVSIDPYGMMTATRNGGAEITATYGGFSARAPAAIFLPMQEIPPFDPELVYFTDDDGSAVILNRIIVHTENEYQRATSDRIAAQHDAVVIAEFANMDAFLMETETSTIEDLETILDQISNDPNVDEAFPDGFIPPVQGPSPTAAKKPETAEWLKSAPYNTVEAYGEVKLPGAWEVLNALPNHTYSHVYVAVIDTGMYSHECQHDFKDASAIKAILEHEFPSSEESGDPLSPVRIHEDPCVNKLDDIAHGTAVVSILAAANNAHTGPGGQNGQFSGVLTSVYNLSHSVLFYQAGPRLQDITEKLRDDLLPVNVQQWLQFSEFYSALDNLTASQVSVLNISFGCEKSSGKRYEACVQELQAAIETFAENSPHTLIVLSAGNDGVERKPWPNIPESVMVVGGAESSCLYGTSSLLGGRRSESNHGADITIAAPYCVYTVVTAPLDPVPRTEYTLAYGTSFSAPLVSGTAALLFAIDSSLTPAEVKKTLAVTGGATFCPASDTTKPCTSDNARLLDAKKAVCETLKIKGVKQAAALCLDAPLHTSTAPAPNTPASTPLQTFPASAVGGDYDHDDDGLIEVRTLVQMDVIRLDRDGDSLVRIDDLSEYLAAFPDALDDMGCPADGCQGYELAASLDFDTNGNGGADAGDAYWNDGAGWEPFGYGGTFDGNGYTVGNLYIDRPRVDNVGLFRGRYRIRNMVLYGVDVTGNANVGGLAGHNSGDISDSTVSGTVTGNANVGGLAGNNDGDISGSTANGDVTGNDNVGGLVGNNGGDISGSTASGDVSGNDNVGGLVGRNERDFANYRNGNISDSTASGTVSGNDYVGGLVGRNDSFIIGSEAEGDATGRFYVGGLAGNNDGDIIDSTASGTVSGNDYVGGLVGNNETWSFRGISGSTASGTVSGNDYVGGLAGNNGGDISGSTASGDVSGNDNVGGLVGRNERDFANYRNGNISDSTASGTVSGNDNVGGLVGRNDSFSDSISISDSTANGDVSGNDYVGGLVGNNDGDISGSTASGTVSGNDNVGGLVGRNDSRIIGSEAEGDATGRFYVGGLVGLNHGVIQGSTAAGNVAGVRWRGALVGTNDRGTVTNGAGTGTVTTRQ